MKRIIVTTACISFICVLCISITRIMLAPLEDSNKRMDRIKNIVKVSSLGKDLDKNTSQKEYEDVFERNFKTIYWNIQGKKISSKKEYENNNHLLYIRNSMISIPEIEEIIPVYVVQKDNAESTEIIMPVYGKGLWSTMYGLISVVGEKLDTIGGVLFYEHGETPGLGDGITKSEWTDNFIGKKPFDNETNINVIFEVVKGGVSSQDKDKDHKVDGISGATLTSKGVEHILRFWLSFDMMGNFLEKIRNDSKFLNE